MVHYQIFILINSNILPSLEDIITLEKSLFSHTFLYHSRKKEKKEGN